MAQPFCPGCKVKINHQPHLHVGAPIREAAGNLYTHQDPTVQEPAIAILVAEASGNVMMVAPEGFPPDAGQPVLAMIRADFQHVVLNPATLRSVHGAAAAAFKLAVDSGMLRRDYMGKWHYAGTP